MEITQFTYFQQAGGIELAPISAELTYGLERIAMVLQRVDSIFDLEWAPGVKYRDVRLRDEVEQSKYAFNVGIELPAGETFAALHRRLFDDYYMLAESLLKAGLVLPALEHTLKCSHLFNILDASNSIGVTERTAFILRHPQAGARRREDVRRADATVASGERLAMDRELLLEIGCEEIPASWLPGAHESGGRSAGGAAARTAPRVRRRPSKPTARRAA